MPRALFIFAALALLVTPARAQDEPTAVTAVAQLMVKALAPSSYGDWAYRWGAVSIRISRDMHWHLFEPDARDRPADAVARRNGWINVRGQNVGISAFGGDEVVTHLTFDLPAASTLALVEALRAEGAEVAFQADYEAYLEYVVTPAGRDTGLLTSTRICTSPFSAAAQRCHDEMTLTFGVLD